MTIQFNQLSNADYSVRRFQVISLVECRGGKPDLLGPTAQTLLRLVACCPHAQGGSLLSRQIKTYRIPNSYSFV